MEKIRYYIYVPVAIIVVYITGMAIVNNNALFNFGYINFSKDEVGNYSSLLGTLVGLFGVVLLVETLWLQFKQFKASEKQKEIDEKLDWYYKLSLLEVDLTSILNDIEKKSVKIKEYFEAEKNDPLYTHLLFRTPSRNYQRILELDRLSIYKAFKNFLGYKEDWLKVFNNLFSIIDFLPEVFKDIYDKYENHYKDIFEQKMKVRDDLIGLMTEAAKILTLYKTEKGDDYLNYPASSAANEMIRRYYEVIGESFDENGNMKSETDFKKIEQNVLKVFITEYLLQRDNPRNFDSRLELLAEIASKMRKDIFLIKSRVLEFSENIELQYNSLNVDNENEKSIVTLIKEIQVIINEGLEKINIENK